jgi:hypothetical protein
MRSRWASALLLALAVPAAASGPDAEPVFAPSLPDGVGSLAGWEIVAGDFESKDARGSYRFYVNPARGALYQLMRYRVELRGPAGAAQPDRGGAERVAFVRRPGVREPMACWERQPAGSTPAWRELAAGTAEYNAEMGVLIQVLAVHRAARAAQP